ncbi:FKBP-type peptidyl-prolyl cis-trans isomerase [Chryseolinea sp. H1M3-3]|uniref:FKBP-type peptidyl-prolyl cis-trans isomerase n=1 Tax=Chryseolinea sp. H1M3-3 TaxID=3034144 RepID=UPI0023EAAA25|nr:FKBP-type peptidyl-prolyl cis-trans isomerase [Chryseolinea sp. H1M3-3]
MRLIIVCLTVLISMPLFSQSKKELIAEVNTLKSQIAELQKTKEADTSNVHKKASYGLGVIIATNLKMQGGDSLDIETLNIALRDTYQGKTLKMDAQKSSMVVQLYMQQMMARKAAEAQQEGKFFLEKNKQTEGVKVTASGLQYKVLSAGAGTGKTPAATDNVTVHYTGKLVDGTVFDSSVQRGKPETFGVGQVIPGWTEGLQLMHEGDKWMLYIPSELAYGEQGAGGQIPPHATLIFEVELIKVN